MPSVVILAGPNGVGKTSAAPLLLHDELRVAEFVNADVIARGLSGFSPDQTAVEAGRAMLQRLDELAGSGRDFAFETTLSGLTFLRSIRRWRSAGYVVHIIYLWLSTAEAAVERVHKRALRGGHAVPDEAVRRRYERGVANFASRYREVADRATLRQFQATRPAFDRAGRTWGPRRRRYRPLERVPASRRVGDPYSRGVHG